MYKYMYIYVCVYIYMDFCFLKKYGYVNAGAPRGQKRMSVPLELELQQAVSCPTWVFGTKLGSSARTVFILFSPVGKKFKFVYY